MARAGEPWSLTSLREKLIKIGAKFVRRGPPCDVPVGQGHGVAPDIPGNAIVDCPAADTTRAGMNGRSAQMRQTTTAEVRHEQGTPLSSGPAGGQPIASPADMEPSRTKLFVAESKKSDPQKSVDVPHWDQESGECRLNLVGEP